MSGFTPTGDRREVQRLNGGGWAYTFLDDAVRIEARYLRRKDGQLHAEVDVQCDWAGAKRHNGSLSCADMNLSSQQARKSLAAYCQERAGGNDTEFDWQGAINAACLEIIRADRQGEQAIVLDDADDVTERDFSVLGLTIPADASSMVIAHGDSLKSFLILLVLGTLSRQGRRVLYLDWEWSAERHKARKRRLFGAERLEGLHYLRMTAPLVHKVDEIRRYCDEHQIEFLAVDSVGIACDGKLTDDDVAIRFHRALSSLPPAMCAAHVPKSAVGPDKSDAIGPFGSVFFSNLCRMSWLVKKQPGATEDTVTVGLFPQKQNSGDRARAVGLEFSFNADVDRTIDVRPTNLVDVEGMADKLPMRERIAGVLKSGPKTYAEIETTTKAKKDAVYQAVNRGLGGTRPIFVKVSNFSDGITRIALAERRGGVAESMSRAS